MDTRNSPFSGAANPQITHTLAPQYGALHNSYPDTPCWGSSYTPVTPATLDYSSYPGIYFPPSSDTACPASSLPYNFTIGDCQTPHTNPLLQYLGGSGSAPAPLQHP